MLVDLSLSVGRIVVERQNPCSWLYLSNSWCSCFRGAPSGFGKPQNWSLLVENGGCNYDWWCFVVLSNGSYRLMMVASDCEWWLINGWWWSLIVANNRGAKHCWSTTAKVTPGKSTAVDILLDAYLTGNPSWPNDASAKQQWPFPVSIYCCCSPSVAQNARITILVSRICIYSCVKVLGWHLYGIAWMMISGHLNSYLANCYPSFVFCL